MGCTLYRRGWRGIGLAAALTLAQACAQGSEIDSGTSTLGPETSESGDATTSEGTTDESTTGATTEDPSAGDAPGITVTAELLTINESGETATFSVVLDSMPSADVTIDLLSSDEAEGVLDQDVLTFTPANWDQAQEVLVTGVDDGEPDGAQLFTVEIAPASSADGGYDGVDADDLEFTNEDLYVHVLDTALEDTSLAVGWGCEVLNVADKLVLVTTQNGEMRWALQIGAGGSLTQIQDVPADIMILPTQLLETGPATEFVTQWTAYSGDVKYDHPDLIGSDDAFHINQAGTGDETFSPTISVEVDLNACIIDVFSVPSKQWFSVLDPYIEGKLSQRTRYKVIGQGRVFVRRTILIDSVVLDGDIVDLDGLNLTNTNFIASGPFAHLAATLNDAGLATQFDKIDELPTKNNTPVTMTSGYLAFMDVNELLNGKILALVYGTQGICGAAKTGCESRGTHTISQSEVVGEHVRIFPTLRLQGVTEGEIIDWSTVLLMQTGTSPVLGGDVLGYEELIAPPVVIPKDGVVYPESFNTLATALRDNLLVPGTETDDLAPLAGL
jgi:hypothetical protein